MRYSLPCVNEGAILEWCNTCNGESRHVRECDIYDKCTRGYVSNKVRSCVRCAQQSNTQYKPDTTQSPPISIRPVMGPNSRRFLLRKALAEREQRRQEQASNVLPNSPEKKVSGKGVYHRTSEMLAISKLKPNKAIKWSYGITTVPQRRTTTLPKTIQSLIMTGFDSPRLFIDVQDEKTYLPDLVKEYQTDFNLPITIRDKNIRTFGNWILALMELYVREPHSDRYALFQDDILACANLREYLEHVEYPKAGYMNLITYIQNDREKQVHAKKLGIDADTMIGWYPSNQMGKGAQALVFDRDCVLQILSNHNILKRPQSANGWQNVDGGINEAMKRAGYLEYVHSPSLVTHQQGKTTMGPTHPQEQPPIQSFRGENWNAMEVVDNL